MSSRRFLLAAALVLAALALLPLTAAASQQDLRGGARTAAPGVSDPETPAPNINVDPTSLSATLNQGASSTQTLTIHNTGDADLEWAIPLAGRTATQAPLPGGPQAPAAAAPLAATDPGYAYKRGPLYTFPLGDFAAQTEAGYTGSTDFANMDFDAHAAKLYALDCYDQVLSTLDFTSGGSSVVGSSVPGEGKWTGFAIDPITDAAFATSGSYWCDPEVSSHLYRIDLQTGAPTLVGDMGLVCVMDIAIGPDGTMVALDGQTNSLYRVDPATAQTTLIGPTGYQLSGWEQGLDFDNVNGTLYLAQGGTGGPGGPGLYYGTVDLATGHLTVSSFDSESENAVIAIANSALCDAGSATWLSLDPLSGTTAGAGSSAVQMTLDSTGQPQGTYRASVCIDSNDPDQARLIVPVTMVVNPAPNFGLTVTPGSQSVCAPADATYTIEATASYGFASPVDLTVSGTPTGATTTFSPNPVTPPGSSTLTIGTADAAAGSYNLTVTGTSGALQHSFYPRPQLTVFTATPAAPALTAPAHASTGAPRVPAFAWTAVDQAATYEVQVATDPAFANVVISAAGLTGSNYTPAVALAPETIYYWRIRAANLCSTGDWSAAWAFGTGATVCVSYDSDDVPTIIEDYSTVDSFVTVPDTFRLSDVNVTVVDLAHSWDEDLEISIAHPDETRVSLFSHRYAKTHAGFIDTKFDDAAVTPISAGQPPYTGSFKPEESLAAFRGKPANGDWKLEVSDNMVEDQGILNAWRIEVCGEVPPPPADFSDLPASYGVAWHAGGGVLRLGPGWTADTSFAPGADNATDDGVFFVGDVAIGQPATMRVNVQGTTANGRWLAVWLDWDRNGAFDAGELVYNDAAGDGDNLLGVAVPGTATAGAVNYRVRLYDAASDPLAVPWGGWGNGGEVEDGAATVIANGPVPPHVDIYLDVSPTWRVVYLGWYADPINTGGFKVHYSENSYFQVGDAGVTTAELTAGAWSWADPAGASDPGHNHYYLMQGVGAGGLTSAPSNRTGAFTFRLTPGTN